MIYIKSRGEDAVFEMGRGGHVCCLGGGDGSELYPYVSTYKLHTLNMCHFFSLEEGQTFEQMTVWKEQAF